jgi:hypothetical protein
MVRLTEKPGVLVSTRKAVTPSARSAGSTVANTITTFAMGALVMNILRPFSTQRSPRRSARVRRL